MMTFNNSLYKKILGRFVTGVTVMSTAENGVLHGVTVNSFSSLSLDPPLICYCLDKKSSLYNEFMNAKYFAVNILSVSQQLISDQFAFGDKSDWDHVPHELNHNNVPIIKEASATIECNTHDICNGGDHSIIIGLVTNLAAAKNPPLAYYAGEYCEVRNLM